MFGCSCFIILACIQGDFLVVPTQFICLVVWFHVIFFTNSIANCIGVEAISNLLFNPVILCPHDFFFFLFLIMVFDLEDVNVLMVGCF